MRRSVLAALAVVVVLGVWMATGLIGDESNDASLDDAKLIAPMRVAVTVVSPVATRREIVVHGELNARRTLDLRSETSGLVASLAVSRGQRVSRGDALVVLDEGQRGADLSEANAKVTMARSEQEAASSLRRQGLQSKVQLEQSSAALESALAQLARIERDLANTTITAPFDGVVNALGVEIGQLIERGDAVAQLVDDSGFEVVARVAQQQLAELEVGQPVSIEPITGGTLTGTLSWISSIADPASRSFSIEAIVDAGQQPIAAGVSASLRIPVETLDAVFVTPSALSLDSDGELGVRTVDADDRVVFVPVTLVSTSLEGAWVAGIESGSRLITLGQGFVSEGELVDPQPADEAIPTAPVAHTDS